jgi:hypothetical protein
MNTTQVIRGFATRGIVLNAPRNDEIPRFEQFLHERLLPNGITTLVLLIRYRFQFDSHPEVVDEPAISKSSAHRIADMCRDAGVALIPKMNLFGHNSLLPGDKEPLGLLRAYPDLEERHSEGIAATRCLCLRHPRVLPLVSELMDEIAEAFGASAFHVGQDEAFEIGKCPRCSGIPPHAIFADWINALHDHLSDNGVTMWMWGDRLLNGNIVPSKAAGYETSLNGTWQALCHVPRDIVICDWHYEVEPYGQLSPSYWAKHRFRHVVCPFRNPIATDQLVASARAADSPYLLGALLTTWCEFADFADAVDSLYPQYRETGTTDYDQYPEDYTHVEYFSKQAACNFMHMFVEEPGR